MPRVQSKGCEAEVKLVRRVTDVERVESSEREMGGKRWSSNALCGEIKCQPVCRCCYSAYF